LTISITPMAPCIHASLFYAALMKSASDRSGNHSRPADIDCMDQEVSGRPRPSEHATERTRRPASPPLRSTIVRGGMDIGCRAAGERRTSASWHGSSRAQGGLDFRRSVCGRAAFIPFLEEGEPTHLEFKCFAVHLPGEHLSTVTETEDDPFSFSRGYDDGLSCIYRWATRPIHRSGSDGLCR
jgi:hypothetical protein